MLLFLKVRKSLRCSQGSNAGGGFGKTTTFLVKKSITFSVSISLTLQIGLHLSLSLKLDLFLNSISLSLSLLNRPIILKFT